MGEIAAANVILALLVPKPMDMSQVRVKLPLGKGKMTKRIVGPNFLNRVKRLEPGRTKRGMGTHKVICKYICNEQH